MRLFDASGDWNFSFPYLGITNVRSIQLIDYEFYWSWLNVTTLTNTFVFDEGSSNISFTIPAGNYLIDDITNAIEVGLNANGTQAYTVSFSNITGLITITGVSFEFYCPFPSDNNEFINWFDSKYYFNWLFNYVTRIR